jgi:cytochrome P450
MSPAMTSDIYYDPYDYEIDKDPHPIWKRMRDEAPLYYNEKFDFFAVSRHADVRDVSVDWRTYTSSLGSVLELIDAGPQVLETVRNMLFEDPPIHDVHRSILARAFTPKRMAALEPAIRELCEIYLEPFVGSSGFDFVQDFGAKIPMMVIGMLLGVPDEDREFLRRFADAAVHRDEGETTYRGGDGLDVFSYFGELVAQRRAEPRDDLASVLVHAEVDDGNGGMRRLDEAELLQYISLVSAAGNETVANLLGWAGVLLDRHPDQRRVLAEDAGAIPNAIDELLRYEAPSAIQARVTTRDVELHGTTVPMGSKVALLTGSANRDERAFPDADRFDVTRVVDHHVAFGFGIHFCLGASLARLEGRIALEEVLRRFPEWEVDQQGAEMVHTSTVRGWAQLPVRL